MTRKTAKRVAPRAIPDVVEFETFCDYRGSHYVGGMKQDVPSCWNSDVKFRKFRIRIELLEEPVEVLAERLQAMWDEGDNYHHVEPLKSSAASIGYTLKGSYGSKRNRGTP